MIQIAVLILLALLPAKPKICFPESYASRNFIKQSDSKKIRKDRTSRRHAKRRVLKKSSRGPQQEAVLDYKFATRTIRNELKTKITNLTRYDFFIDLYLETPPLSGNYVLSSTAKLDTKNNNFTTVLISSFSPTKIVISISFQQNENLLVKEYSLKEIKATVHSLKVVKPSSSAKEFFVIENSNCYLETVTVDEMNKTTNGNTDRTTEKGGQEKTETTWVGNEIVNAVKTERRIREKEKTKEILMREKEYIAERRGLVDTNDNSKRKIALCFSGGGIRAAVAAASVVELFEERGMLQEVNFLSALSGSAWFLIFWALSGEEIKKFCGLFFKALDDRKAKDGTFLDRLTRSWLAKLINPEEKSEFIELFGKEVSKVILGEKLFDKIVSKSITELSLTKPKLVPYPIINFVSPLQNSNNYDWIELTPFFWKSWVNNTFSEIDFFEDNRCFQGVSGSRMTVEKIIGSVGSAISVNILEAISALRSIKELVLDWINQVVQKNPMLNCRMVESKAPNFLFRQLNKKNANQRFLHLLDAGIISNLPLLPLLSKNRKVDLIVAFDFSSSIRNGKALRKAITYAKKVGVKIEKIDRTIQKNSPILIKNFFGKTKLIYLPFEIEDRILKKKFKTTKFEYSNEELIMLRSIVKSRADGIIKTIKNL